MSTPTAQWDIHLHADCPSCGLFVDLLEDPGFWDSRKLEIGEHMTPRSKGVAVFCPECSHEFHVDLEY